MGKGMTSSTEEISFSPILRTLTIESADHLHTFSDAIETYGERAQELIAVEEMAELIKEIMKCHRYNIEPTDAMLKEFVDVCICMAQLELILINNIERAPEKMWNEWIYKMDRLKAKIGEHTKIRGNGSSD